MPVAIVHIPLLELQAFFFIFLRVGAIVMTLPVLDNRTIPILFKAGLALGISLHIHPLVDSQSAPALLEVLPFGIGVVNEILLGVLVGLSVKLVFVGVQMAGQLAGFQMGFSIANIFDPGANSQISLLAQIYHLAALLVFLTLDAHHLLIRAIVNSFRLVPPLGFRLTGPGLERFLVLSGDLFTVAVKVGAPIVIVMLLFSVGLAIVSRAVPQMNVFFVAMPAQIAVGLFFIGVTFPFLLQFLKITFENLHRTVGLILMD